tara:strand:+ start:110 stop:340 length:231 start_codon:yes stop_codon:yes gene_type:complete
MSGIHQMQNYLGIQLYPYLLVKYQALFVSDNSSPICLQYAIITHYLIGVEPVKPNDKDPHLLGRFNPERKRFFGCI